MQATLDKHCPDCGALLLANTPGGQCPRCLLSLANNANAPLTSDIGTSPPDATLNTPPRRAQLFGDYELLEVIGQGGMGKVYRARQLSLNRILALKMIHAGRFAGPEEIARFKREAEAAAGLDHPNIVPIYEVGEHQEQHYFTMKLIEGQTLAQKSAHCRARNTEWIRELVMLLSSVAQGLHHAHQRGIMHRDLKPANILLTTDGEPVITDFGLAHIIDSSVDLTRPEGILGTLGYMAPEQLNSKSQDLTTAIDIHALGCVLYELLTGRTPHHAGSTAEMIRKLSFEEIQSPSRINRNVDRDLATICLKCVERLPERRYHSAAALSDDLDSWLRGMPIQARPTYLLERAVKWIKREPLKAGAALFAVLIVLLTSYFTSRFWLARLPHMAIQHAVESANYEGEFLLKIRAWKGDRITDNFWRYGFNPPGQWLRLEFLGVPDDVASSLRCVIRADQPGRPDPARSEILTNGQSFVLKYEADLDRSFYVASVGWSVTNLLATCPDAVAKLTLLSNKTLQAKAPPQVHVH